MYTVFSVQHLLLSKFTKYRIASAINGGLFDCKPIMKTSVIIIFLGSYVYYLFDFE